MADNECPNPEKLVFRNFSEAKNWLKSRNITKEEPYPCNCGRVHLRTKKRGKQSKMKKRWREAHMRGEHQDYRRTRCQLCHHERVAEDRGLNYPLWEPLLGRSIKEIENKDEA